MDLSIFQNLIGMTQTEESPQEADSTTMQGRIQIVIEQKLQELPTALQMLVNPYLKQLTENKDALPDEKIMDFIEQLEEAIKFVKGDINES